MLSKLSALEFDLDTLIFALSERYPDEACRLSRRYPHEYERKIEFLVDFVIERREFRQCCDEDGILDLNKVCYGLEEVLAFRNAFIHGAIRIISHEKGRTSVCVEKYSRVAGVAGTFELTQFMYSVEYLERIVDEIGYQRAFLRRMMWVVEGKDYAAWHRDALRGRVALHEMLDVFKVHPGATAD